jgi:S-DNA-T family DNA segregation ATPase FtsK/SpoIIIE
LMIAGATGTGKSVAVNAIITALLYQNSPRDLKFIMVDPKRVELSLYNKIPHLLTEVIVENKKAISVLKWAVGEMEKRYRLMQDVSSKDIASYNREVAAGK